jgi:predicted metalloprotease
MRLGGRQSDNVVDARGGGGGMKLAGGGIGTLVLILIAYFLGIDPSALLQTQGEPQAQTAPREPGSAGAPADPAAAFVGEVLADTEDTWRSVFRERLNREYEDPQLVLFDGAVQSACGFAQAAMGPFYCPMDRRVYIDLDFYRDLRERFGAPGDFAQAYVIAHEIGHHVQNLIGVMDRVGGMQRRADRATANALSVRQELQADCFAGLWANQAQRVRNRLEPGDLEEALQAASAIGDDRLQQQSRGYVVPESFTHGSSAQRQAWFRRGYDGGRLESCDTFNAPAS